MTNYLKVPKRLSEILDISYSEAIRIVDLVGYLLVSDNIGNMDSRSNTKITPYIGSFIVKSSKSADSDTNDAKLNVEYKPSSSILSDLKYSRYENYDPSVEYLQDNIGSSIIKQYKNIVKDYYSLGDTINKEDV